MASVFVISTTASGSAHGARLVDYLDTSGDTVVTTAMGVTGSTSSGAMDGFWGSGHDMIVMDYSITTSSHSTITTWAKAKWDAGTPILVTGNFGGSLPVGYGLGTAVGVHDASPNAFGIVIVATSHPIVLGLSSPHSVQTNDNYFYNLTTTSGTVVGTSNATSGLGGKHLVAWEDGDALASGNAPARAVFFGSLDFQFGALPASGADLIGRIVDWLTEPAGITGAVGATLPALTSSAAATSTVTGSAAATLPALSAALEAFVPVTVTGDAAATLPALTSALTATSTATGAAAATLPALSVAIEATADDTVAGALAATLPALSASVAVDLPSSVVVAATLPALTSALAVTVTGAATDSITATLPALSSSVVGVNGAERISAARVTTPSNVRVIVPLVPVADITEAEPLLRVSHVMPVLSAAHPVGEAGVTYPRPTKTEIGYVHLWIGGEDVTYLRDVPTVIRRWESETPFGDTAAAFEFPQLNPWDVPGSGDLACLYPDAPVAIGIVHEGVTRRVWSGFLDARGNGIGEGEDYAWEAKGTLWAAHHGIREPVPFTTPTDIGVLIARALNAVIGRRWATMPETPIGILTRNRGSRDESHWDYVQALLSEAWTDDGRQWTLLEAAPGIFALRLKPLPSVVDATVAYGTPGVEIDLRVDESTRVDGVYARAIAPGGGGWANIFYPALELLNPPPYPNADAGQNMNLGDTDAGTTSGTGVTDWQRRVVEIGTFDTPAISGVQSAAWVAVAREVQAAIGVLVDGSVGPQTWNATFDRGGEGIDLTPLRLPLAVKPHIMPRLYTATGVDRGPNPLYDETVVPRFIAVDLGPMKTKTEGRVLARNILSVYGEAEAFGTATWIFDPNETDRTRLTHLTNVKVTGHEGEDRVLTVVRKSVELEASDEGPVYVVTTTLDQRARDAMAVEDLLEQKRSAQADPSRRPGNPAKASRQVADQRTPWDSESPCGVLRRTAVNGAAGLPSVITIPFAEVGKLAGIRLQSTQPFAFMLCASLRITENRAHAAVAPFSSTDPWRQAKAALDEFGPIEAWGEQGNRCGFSPGTENATDPAYPFSGDFILDSPVDYWTETPPYISLVVWMDGASGFIEGTFIPAYEGA